MGEALVHEKGSAGKAAKASGASRGDAGLQRESLRAVSLSGASQRQDSSKTVTTVMVNLSAGSATLLARSGCLLV